jgi:predicted ribosome quality control (RQC) complex YloA/Tae2 family protein
MRLGSEYNLSLRQNYGGAPPLTKKRIKDALQKALDKQQPDTDVKGKNAKKKGNKDVIRKALAVSITEYPPLLVDHALHIAEFDTTLKLEQVLEDDSLLDKLLASFDEARKVSEDITSRDITKGFILAKPNPATAAPVAEGASSEDKASDLLYDDFHPFRPKQFEGSDYTFLEFEGYNKTVDEYFSSIEGQKLESKLYEHERNAKKKLDKARQEHAKRIGGLQQVQELNVRKAEAIQANVERVQEATAAMNGLIGQGMDWVEIARLIEREQKQGNAVGQMIKLPLKLYENTVTLLLDEPSLDDDEDEGYETSSVSGDSDDDDIPQKKKKPPPKPVDKRLAIDIDLGLSPWVNAKQYFDQKKSAVVKEEKTIQASTMALKSIEKKVNIDLKKGLKQEKAILQPVRKQNWFEKFMYFISSDGYLVIGCANIFLFASLVS